MSATICPCGIAVADCAYHRPDANAVLRDRARRIEADCAEYYSKRKLRPYRVGDKLRSDLRSRGWVVVSADPHGRIEIAPEIGPMPESDE